jgi:hypothetical protein
MEFVIFTVRINYNEDLKKRFMIPPGAAAGLRRLVLAAGVQRRQDEQVRKRKQPVVGLPPCGHNRSRDEADVPGARQIVEMLEADARQVGSLRVREDLLTGLDLDHGLAFSRSSIQEETRVGR